MTVVSPNVLPSLFQTVRRVDRSVLSSYWIL